MSEILDSINTHLEFLGYSIEPTSDNKGFLATHAQNANFLIKEVVPSFFYIQVIYGLNETANEDKLGFLTSVNEFNATKLLFTHCYATQNLSQLYIETFITNYDKTLFGRLVVQINVEIQKILNKDDSLRQYLV